MVLYILKANGETETREVKLAGPASRSPGRGTVAPTCPGPCLPQVSVRIAMAGGSVPVASPGRMGTSASNPSLTCSLGFQEESIAIVPEEKVLLGQPVDG